MDLLKSMPDDQQRLIISFFLMLPLGWVMNLFHCRNIRLAYSLIFGIIIQYYVYGFSMMHVFIAACVNLIILKTFKNNLGKIALIYNFGHNSLIHLYRLLFEYENWSIEISVIFMIVTCKFSAFAFSYEDGLKLEDESAINDNSNDKDIKKVQNHYMIKDFSIFEYFSFVYFFPTAICGPFIEYRDFITYIERKNEYSEIPNTIFPSVLRITKALIFSGIYTFGKKYADVEFIIDAENKYSFSEKVFHYVVGCVHEYKYVGAFYFAETAIIASGLAYNGKKDDPKHDKWGKVKSIDFIKLQLVYNPSEFFHHWNITIHHFLKKYVYVRLLPKNANFSQKQLASSQTFFFSAFWHGFHPTYFVVFAHFYLYTLIQQQLKTLMRTLNMEKVPYESIFINLVRAIILLYLVPYHCYMFVSLDHFKLMEFLKTVYFGGTMLVVSINIILFVLRMILAKKKKFC
jgi:lysophospholipid acyltransferase